MSAPKAEVAGLTVERREQIAAEHAPATTNLSWCSVDQQDWPCETRLLLDALAVAEVEVAHWKGHAEEAGRGFTQVCKDYARSAARVSRVGTWLERHEHMGRPCACYDEVRAALDTATSEGA